MNLINIFDILSAVITVVSLNLVHRYYQMWLLYTAGTVLFIAVCWSNHLPGLTLMGFCLLFTGIRNYYLGYREKKERDQWIDADLGSGLE
jgi:nicotinamide riboside transporter PnuC